MVNVTMLMHKTTEIGEPFNSTLPLPKNEELLSIRNDDCAGIPTGMPAA